MNIAVAQSGGPTSAINASLAGVFKAARSSGKIETIYGCLNGIEGVIKDRMIDLGKAIPDDEAAELLKRTPSTALGSCRYKLPDADSQPQVYEDILSCLEKHGIGAFFYIGGNDSMDTVAKLSAYFKKKGSPIKFVGVPKTIDNDLPCTDHTPGFGSAAKYVAVTTQEIIRDSSVYSLESVTIIEVMGRHAGWLTASTCVLRANGEIAPHLIYLPECEFSAQRFLDDIREQQKKHKAVIIAVSEGVQLKDSKCLRSDKLDVFGHQQLSGIGKTLEELVRSEIGCKVRSIELNVMQRCSSHIASATDLDEAELIGAKAVEYALDGKSGIMMVFEREKGEKYSVNISCADAALVANKEQFFPMEWVNDEHNNVKDEAIGYFLPLIQGEVERKMNNGMPVHFKLDM